MFWNQSIRETWNICSPTNHTNAHVKCLDPLPSKRWGAKSQLHLLSAAHLSRRGGGRPLKDLNPDVNHQRRPGDSSVSAEAGGAGGAGGDWGDWKVWRGWGTERAGGLQKLTAALYRAKRKQALIEGFAFTTCRLMAEGRRRSPLELPTTTMDSQSKSAVLLMTAPTCCPYVAPKSRTKPC